MSYVALGKDYSVRLSLLGKSTTIKIKIPIEQIEHDARQMAVQTVQGTAQQAIDAVWPMVQQKLYSELPQVMDKALTAAKPVIRQEVDRTLDKATGAAAMVATGLAVVIVGSAMWIRRGIKRR